jgi:hypothetical protein
VRYGWTTIVPVIIEPWAVQKYGNVPGDWNVRSNVMPDPTPESHWPSGVQPPLHEPDVVEWKPLCQIQWTTLPARIVVVLLPLVLSTNVFPPLAPTSTVAEACGCGVAVGVGFPGGGVGVGVGLPGIGVAVGAPGRGVAVGAGTGPGFVTVSSLQRAPARIASTTAAERKIFRPMSYLLKGTSRRFVIDASLTRDVVARQVPRGEIESVLLGNV